MNPFRWIRNRPFASLSVFLALLLFLLVMFQSWVDKHPGLAAVGATIGLLWVTGWYAVTTRRILDANQGLAVETQNLAMETRRLAATGARSLFMQSIPVIAVQHFPTVPGGRLRELSGPLILQNVGQSAAIVNQIRVELNSLGGGGQFLDTKGLGSELLNLRTGHAYALAPRDTLTIELGEKEYVGLVETDPLYSACEVEYADIVGNLFRAKHEPGRLFTIEIMENDGSWASFDNVSVDPETGRFVPREE